MAASPPLFLSSLWTLFFVVIFYKSERRREAATSERIAASEFVNGARFLALSLWRNVQNLQIYQPLEVVKFLSASYPSVDINSCKQKKNAIGLCECRQHGLHHGHHQHRAAALRRLMPATRGRRDRGGEPPDWSSSRSGSLFPSVSLSL